MKCNTERTLSRSGEKWRKVHDLRVSHDDGTTECASQRTRKRVTPTDNLEVGRKMAKSARPPGLTRRWDDRMCLTAHQKEGDANGQLGGGEKNAKNCTTSKG